MNGESPFANFCTELGKLSTVGRKCSKMAHWGKESHSLTRTARSTPLRSAAHHSAPFRTAALRSAGAAPLRSAGAAPLRSAPLAALVSE